MAECGLCEKRDVTPATCDVIFLMYHTNNRRFGKPAPSHPPLGSSRTQSSDVLREGIHALGMLCQSLAAPSHVPIMNYQYLSSTVEVQSDLLTALPYFLVLHAC